MQVTEIKNIAKQYLLTKDIKYKKQIEDYYKTLVFKTRSNATKITKISYVGSVNSSAKIVKNATLNYNTYIVYMSPHKSSGYNTCAKASKGCIDACLNTSGRVKMDIHNSILSSRLLKTWLFYSNREFFNKWMFAEIESAKKLSKKNGREFSCRVNGTTDLDIGLFNVDGKNVLDRFDDVQFYDYTKLFNRLGKHNPKNYHLTFSHSGENDDEVEKALIGGYNVAVPFYIKKGQKLPTTYKGFGVGDADETDLRFLDVKPIAGLRVKLIKDKTAITRAIHEGFIVV